MNCFRRDIRFIMKIIKSLKIKNKIDITEIKKTDFSIDFEGTSYLQDESHMSKGKAQAIYTRKPDRMPDCNRRNA